MWCMKPKLICSFQHFCAFIHPVKKWSDSTCEIWPRPLKVFLTNQLMAVEHLKIAPLWSFCCVSPPWRFKTILTYPSLRQTEWFSCRGCSRMWASPRMRRCRPWCPGSPATSLSSLCSSTRSTATPRSPTSGWGRANLLLSNRLGPL